MPQSIHNHFKVVIFNLPIIITIFQYILVSSEANPQHILLHMRQTLKDCKFGYDCPQNAYCSDSGTCLCIDGYLVSSNRTELKCLKVATNFGDFCHEDVQCRVTFTVQAECRDNTCVCSEGSHYAKDQRRCYKSAGIGEMCDTTSNCFVKDSKSYCVDGYCRCPLLHHPTADGRSCLPDLFLGHICRIDDECITNNSQCRGECDCKIGYVLSKDEKQCLKAASSIGDPCEEDLQCKGPLKHAMCGEEKRCTCVLDTKRRGSECLRKINPDMMGKKCSTRAQCVKPMPETNLTEEEVVNVHCLEGICSCAQDYILTEDRTDCIRYSENGAEQTMATFLLPILIVSRLFGIV